VSGAGVSSAGVSGADVSGADVSGAGVEILPGCQGAKTMVAVNTDPDAPIMARADYAVVGDLA
jgi:electron transfer flavoprotein alpha subunit